MTERAVLIERIIGLETYKASLATRALACETAGEFDLVDHCDAKWNATNDELGRLHARLYEIEAGSAAPNDPRDPRSDREMVGRDPIFRNHNCSRCRSGERACVRGDPRRCEWPHARND